MPAVELVDVRKSYTEAGQERAVLTGINLSLDPGELAVLIGRSGSGKSTMLNLVSGIDQPTSGTVRVAGTDLTQLNEAERTRFRRDRIGFVFQSFNLIPTLTVGENVWLPIELQRGLDASSRQRGLDLLAEVGLADRADSFPDRLSGGEQQRVAIARALAHEPALVLADEPTGNLDYETGRRIVDLLERLSREAGTTLLVVTHDLDLTPKADRVVELSQGTLQNRSAADLNVRIHN